MSLPCQKGKAAWTPCLGHLLHSWVAFKHLCNLLTFYVLRKYVMNDVTI